MPRINGTVYLIIEDFNFSTGGKMKKTAKTTTTKKNATTAKKPVTKKKMATGTTTETRKVSAATQYLDEVNDDTYFDELVNETKNGKLNALLHRLSARLVNHFKRPVFVDLRVGFAGDEYR